FVGLELFNFSLVNARENEAIGGFVGARGISAVDVNVFVAGAGVVGAEVEKGRAAKAFLEFPGGGCPTMTIVDGPEEWGIGEVALEHEERVVEHEQAAGFWAGRAVAEIFRCGFNVRAGEVRRIAANFGETKADFAREKRFEAISIAERTV